MERTYHKIDKIDVTAFWGKVQDYLSFEHMHINETVLTIQALVGTLTVHLTKQFCKQLVEDL